MPMVWPQAVGRAILRWQGIQAGIVGIFYTKQKWRPSMLSSLNIFPRIPPQSILRTSPHCCNYSILSIVCSLIPLSV